MSALFIAAKEVTDFMKARRWKYCVIGGLAVLRWGRPRTTLDADIAVLTGYGHEADFARPLLKRFKSRISSALEFACANRVMLLRASNGKNIDLSFAALPFEEEMMARATLFRFTPKIALRTCSAEDLIIMKAFAARPQDWVDIEGIVVRRKGRLDVPYLARHLGTLGERGEKSEILMKVRSMLESAS